jgi:predicted acyltransferase
MMSGQDNSAVQSRIGSLDALRGLTVLVWLFSATMVPVLYQLPRSRFASTLADQLSPSFWRGITVYDLLLPMFLFVSGASIVPAFKKHKAAGRTNRQSAWRLVRRLVLLFGIGILCERAIFQHWPCWRFAGAFQRIAVCYAVVAALNLRTDSPFQVGVLAFLLADYCAILAFGSNGAGGAYSFEGNAAANVDQLLLPGCKYFGTWDSQGLLTTLPAIAVTLAGLLAGKALTAAGASPTLRTFSLLGVGIVAVNAGILGDALVPINPYLWTLPFCLVAIGAGSVLLGALYAVLDVRQKSDWATPVSALGRNSLLVVLATLALSNAADWIARLALPRAHFPAWSLIIVLVVWMMALFLNRHKLFITV